MRRKGRAGPTTAGAPRFLPPTTGPSPDCQRAATVTVTPGSGRAAAGEMCRYIMLGGRMTLSMAWMTPFDVAISAATTLAPLTVTPLRASM